MTSVRLMFPYSLSRMYKSEKLWTKLWNRLSRKHQGSFWKCTKLGKMQCILFWNSLVKLLFMETSKINCLSSNMLVKGNKSQHKGLDKFNFGCKEMWQFAHSLQLLCSQLWTGICRSKQRICNKSNALGKMQPSLLLEIRLQNLESVP